MRAITDAEVHARILALRSLCAASRLKVTADDLVRENVAARFLGYEPKTLRNDRSGARRWPYVQRGRLVFYRLADLAIWMVENSVEQ